MTHFDDDDDDTAWDIDDLFPFTLAERDLLKRLGASLRKRLVSADPDTLRKIAAFLYALERLPHVTPDVSLDLAIMSRVNENLSYVSVEMDGGTFRLSTGGHEYSPAVGGDSYSETTYEIEKGGFRDGTFHEFNDWLHSFVSAHGTIEIQGDCDTDLTEPSPEDGWDRLAKYWDSQVGEADGW